MRFVLPHLIKYTVAFEGGTVDFPAAGTPAAQYLQPADVLTDGDAFFYRATLLGGGWEIGRGIYDAGTATIQRAEALASDANPELTAIALTDFPAGTMTIEAIALPSNYLASSHYTTPPVAHYNADGPTLAVGDGAVAKEAGATQVGAGIGWLRDSLGFGREGDAIVTFEAYPYADNPDNILLSASVGDLSRGRECFIAYDGYLTATHWDKSGATHVRVSGLLDVAVNLTITELKALQADVVWVIGGATITPEIVIGAGSLTLRLTVGGSNGMAVSGMLNLTVSWP